MAECPDRLVFDERVPDSTSAPIGRVWITVSTAQPVLTSHQRATLLTCLLSMGDVLPEWSRLNRLPAETMTFLHGRTTRYNEVLTTDRQTCSRALCEHQRCSSISPMSQISRSTETTVH